MLLLLLNYVVIVAKLCCVEGLMEDACLISTLVNKSLYFYFYNYNMYYNYHDYYHSLYTKTCNTTMVYYLGYFCISLTLTEGPAPNKLVKS